METVETRHMTAMEKKNRHCENQTYRSRKDNKLALAKIKREMVELREQHDKDGTCGNELLECRIKHRELCNKLRSKGADRRARAVSNAG